MRAVFISYASEDLAAAERLRASLCGAGTEVWFDKSALRGGEAWDASIRRQIRSCALFIPVISGNTLARAEGYFRLEWKLAVDRSHLIAPHQPFLLPVVIDDTRQADERVPERFRELQWSNAPGGVPSSAFVERVAHLLATGQAPGAPAAPSPLDRPDSDTRKLTHPPPRDRRLHRKIAWLAAAALVAAACFGVYELARWNRARTHPSEPIASDREPPRASSSLKPRIAVLPFENLSPDPGNAFFTDGMHEEILTTLASRASGLEVISRTTMNSYKGKAVDVQTLMHDLHCTYVLEGSVRREGHDVRIALQLVDARNDSPMWTQEYDRRLESAMALESDIAAAVAAQLSLRFAGARPAAASTSNAQAYDLYLKGRAAQSNAQSPDPAATLHDAERYLDQAISIDPGFVRARLERMQLHVRLFLYNYEAPDDMLPLAHGDLEAARRLAPSDPMVTGWAAVLAYAELDYERALTLFDGAEAAGIADPELLGWKQELLFAMGRYPQAVTLSRRLAELDPKNEDAQTRWWYMLMEMHDFSDALHLAETGIRQGRDLDAWRESRSEVLFYAGGDLEPRRASYAASLARPWRTVQDLQDNLGGAFAQLFLEHRFRDLRSLIDGAPPVEAWNCTYVEWPLYRVGLTPVADIRGWTDLLLGDREQLRQDGRRIVDYLEHHPETRWNRWYRFMLRADAQLFMGDEDAANRTAAEAVALTRSTPDVSDQMNAYVWSTQIMAWTSAKEGAVGRLTELSTSVPGLWPGEITGNPVFSVPLGSNEGYKALSARLTAQMHDSGLH